MRCIGRRQIATAARLFIRHVAIGRGPHRGGFRAGLDARRQQVAAKQHGAGDFGQRHTMFRHGLETETAIHQLDLVRRSLHQTRHHLAEDAAQLVTSPEDGTGDGHPQAATARAKVWWCHIGRSHGDLDHADIDTEIISSDLRRDGVLPLPLQVEADDDSDAAKDIDRHTRPFRHPNPWHADGGIDGADVELFFVRWEAGC